MNVVNRIIPLAVLLTWSGLALAQELFIYPGEGQDEEQQEADKYQCYSWAKDETGFDPMAVPTASEPPPEQEQKKGGVRRGAFRGAALGAVIDGSDGAKKGAVTGGAVGGIRRRDQQRRQVQAQQQWEQEQQAQYQENRNRYNRAYSACLEARGYTVQ
jgi:hypothetical protein